VKHTVEKGKTLLVDGPASINILSGQVEVLGAPLRTGVKMVIREGKRIPLEVREKAEFDLTLSEKAAANEVEGSTIPVSWEKAVDEILSREKPVTVMVVGGIDSGKTSFCAYLANRALKDKQRVDMIDADLGQSDVGPPSTIGSCRLTKPVVDPFEIGAESICFIGVTSPSGAVSKVVEGINSMREKALKRGVGVLIINTDGWIEGEEAVLYKVALVKQVRPNLLVGIQEKSELTFLLGALVETQNLVVESSPAVRKRDREERKLLRELGYKKYLKGARAESFPLRWTRIAGVAFGTGVLPSRERMKRIEESLGATPLYCEELPNFVFIALDKEQWVDEELVKDLEQKLNRRVLVAREGDEEGLLVAFHDANENFLGIGVLEGIDYERRVVRVYTPVRKDAASLHLGVVKLDRKGREIGISDVFAEYV
jgi:polynucleotide 5'-hydroxyl-kinase GRC3/NOL9